MTQERLHQLLNYDPKTGIFTWKIRKGRMRAGTRAGYIKSNGYEAIMLDWKMYFSHRLAWLFVHGSMPDYIDHINTIPLDNRIENLRPCSPLENCSNQKIRPNNTSGVKGVSWSKAAKKWVGEVGKKGHKSYIGLFNSIEEAEQAVRIHRIKIHGEFARHS